MIIVESSIQLYKASLAQKRDIKKQRYISVAFLYLLNSLMIQ